MINPESVARNEVNRGSSNELPFDLMRAANNNLTFGPEHLVTGFVDKALQAAEDKASNPNLKDLLVNILRSAIPDDITDESANIMALALMTECACAAVQDDRADSLINVTTQYGSRANLSDNQITHLIELVFEHFPPQQYR